MTINYNFIRKQGWLIGRNIHTARLKRKFTLRKLSRLSGISETLLDQYEMGKNRMGVDELLKIAFALEVGIGRLVSGFPLEFTLGNAQALTRVRE